MKTGTLFFLLLVICATNLSAQNTKNAVMETVTASNFALPGNASIDENAGAVIISNAGSIHFTGNKTGRWVSYVFTKKERIKIINKTAFKLATVKIYLQGKNERQDKLDNLKASTYNLENGKLIETVLNQQDVFEDRLGPSIIEKKFTFPNIKEGSVIEYSYTITSYHYSYLPSWEFQYLEFPCLYSSVEIAVPDLLRYVMLRKGLDSISFIQSPDTHESMMVEDLTVSTQVHHYKWEMKNIGAFKESDYINTYRDYVGRIEFQLIQTYNGQDISSTINWNGADKELLASGNFGQAITLEKSANLFNTMQKISGSTTNLLEAAKNIYSYVRDNFECIEDEDIYLDRDLYEVNKSRKGSVAELNLLLVSLLRQKGLNADPVILSTTGYGVHPVVYPVLNKMNYVICMLKIYGDTLYLDASKPLLGFNKLPMDCYNGHARIISDKDTGAVYLFSESVKELKSTTVFIQNDEKIAGKMTGNFQSVPGYHQSYNIRKTILKQGLDNYFKSIKNALGSDITIENERIDSLKNPEVPINVHYDFNFNAGNEKDDLIYYNPMLAEGYKENPFASAVRRYPVEFPAPIDNIYVFSMEIPNGYTIDEMPKSAKVAFNGNDGFFEYLIQKDDTGIQLRCRLKINRTFFRADEYATLRDFFAFAVKKQAEQIIFKRNAK